MKPEIQAALAAYNEWKLDELCTRIQEASDSLWRNGLRSEAEAVDEAYNLLTYLLGRKEV